MAYYVRPDPELKVRLWRDEWSLTEIRKHWATGNLLHGRSMVHRLVVRFLAEGTRTNATDPTLNPTQGREFIDVFVMEPDPQYCKRGGFLEACFHAFTGEGYM